MATRIALPLRRLREVGKIRALRETPPRSGSCPGVLSTAVQETPCEQAPGANGSSCSAQAAIRPHGSVDYEKGLFSGCASGLRPAALHAFAAFPKGDRPERVRMLRPVQDFLPAGTYALLRQTWNFSTFTLLIVVNALPVRSRHGHTRECGVGGKARREATNAKRNCLR